MHLSYNKKTALFLISAVFLIFIDFLAKFYAVKYNAVFIIFKSFFSYSFTKNYYIAFSLPFSGEWLIVTIALVILTIIAIACKLLNKHDILAWPLLYVIAGSLSNLYDRINYGFVVDYLDLRYFTVFNLADLMISGGLLVFIILLAKEKNQSRSTSAYLSW